MWWRDTWAHLSGPMSVGMSDTKGWKTLKWLSPSASFCLQVSSEQLCPTWTGKRGTSTCLSSRPKTWWVRWADSPAPPPSLSHSPMSTTTHLGSLTVRLLIVQRVSAKLVKYCTYNVLNSYLAIRINPPGPCFICSGFYFFSEFNGPLKIFYNWKTTWTQRTKWEHTLCHTQWMQWYKKAELLFHLWEEVSRKY